MNPDAATIWRAPRWTLAVLLAALGMLGPFSIDTFFPSFRAMQAEFGISDLSIQQTLTAYMLRYAVMSLASMCRTTMEPDFAENWSQKLGKPLDAMLAQRAAFVRFMLNRSL